MEEQYFLIFIVRLLCFGILVELVYFNAICTVKSAMLLLFTLNDDAIIQSRKVCSMESELVQKISSLATRNLKSYFCLLGSCVKA